MGKELIIKGADFSENALSGQWLYGYTQTDFETGVNNVDPAFGSYAPVQFESLRGHNIRKIKIIPKVAGIITILASDTLYGELTPVGTITISPNEVGVITEYNVNINVGLNSIISIVASGDTGKFGYYREIHSTVDSDFYYLVGTSDATLPQRNGKLLVDYYYI